MKRFIEFCFDVRVFVGEVGETAGFVLLIAFGVYADGKNLAGNYFNEHADRRIFDARKNNRWTTENTNSSNSNSS